jgi:hypothetical protein
MRAVFVRGEKQREACLAMIGTCSFELELAQTGHSSAGQNSDRTVFGLLQDW